MQSVTSFDTQWKSAPQKREWMNITLTFIAWVGESSERISKGISTDTFIETSKAESLKENNELRIIKKGNAA